MLEVEVRRTKSMLDLSTTGFGVGVTVVSGTGFGVGVTVVSTTGC